MACTWATCGHNSQQFAGPYGFTLLGVHAECSCQSCWVLKLQVCNRTTHWEARVGGHFGDDSYWTCDDCDYLPLRKQGYDDQTVLLTDMCHHMLTSGSPSQPFDAAGDVWPQVIAAKMGLQTVAMVLTQAACCWVCPRCWDPGEIHLARFGREQQVCLAAVR